MGELQILREVYSTGLGLRETAPVDDHFPEMMSRFDLALGRASKLVNTTPKIVCLCGSTKFKQAFMDANKQETFEGNIVLSVGCFPHADGGGDPEVVLGHRVKEELDRLHKQKIDLADEVLVLNVGGYIGSSTKSEIEHAIKSNKPIRYLEEAEVK